MKSRFSKLAWGGAVLFFLVLGLVTHLALRSPHSRWARLGAEATVRLDASDPLHDTVVITLADGARTTGLLRKATSGVGTHAAILLIGGHRTGRNAARLVEDTTLVVMALDYPYEGPQKLRGFRQIVGGVVEIHRAVYQTPALLIAARRWLATRSDVAGDSIVGVGVSLGGPFILAAAAADPGFAGIGYHFSGGSLATWMEANLKLRVSKTAAWFLSRLGALLCAPFEPERNLARLPDTLPILVISGTEDQRVPFDDLETVFRNRARIMPIPAGHVEPEEKAIIREITSRTIAWMQEEITQR